MDLRIFPPEELIEDGLVSLPLSKSILNRCLILDAMTPGAKIPAAGAPDEGADVAALRSIVRAVTASEKGTMELNAGESGTALRFLTAWLATRGEGQEYILTGLPGLFRRPVAPLVDALRTLGADIEYIDKEGYAPLRIKSHPMKGGSVTVDPTVSSQYVSALLLAAPLMKDGVRITFDGEPSSLPYIKMTAGMMRRRGVDVELTPLSAEVAPGKYHPDTEPAEADWSATAFWYETVALTAGWVTMTCPDGRMTLPEESIQGDAKAAEFFGCLGVLTEPSEERDNALQLSPSPEVYGRLDLDLKDYPDLTPALAVTCCMLGVPFHFTGLGALSVKESDRLSAIVEEMAKVGCEVEKIRTYGLEWDGKRHPIFQLPEFDPRNDHRLAMALAPVAAYIPGIVVKDVECVAKSYPGFWHQLSGLGFRFADASANSSQEAPAEV